ncbi:MAG: hypothetical protein NXI30_02135 [bacterium]|nr:hypothetical protein [bacterium]
MAESKVFAWLCERLEADTDLDRLEARGTVRICLKQAGLIAADLSPAQAATVVEKVLPQELEARGVAEADVLCERLAHNTQMLTDERSEAAPDEVFGSLTRS